MSEVNWFGWVLIAMSAVTVIVWATVAGFVLIGAWELLRDAWRAWKEKA